MYLTIPFTQNLIFPQITLIFAEMTQKKESVWIPLHYAI